jgi:hypothetical protein
LPNPMLSRISKNVMERRRIRLASKLASANFFEYLKLFCRLHTKHGLKHCSAAMALQIRYPTVKAGIINDHRVYWVSTSSCSTPYWFAMIPPGSTRLLACRRYSLDVNPELIAMDVFPSPQFLLHVKYYPIDILNTLTVIHPIPPLRLQNISNEQHLHHLLLVQHKLYAIQVFSFKK